MKIKIAILSILIAATGVGAVMPILPSNGVPWYKIPIGIPNDVLDTSIISNALWEQINAATNGQTGWPQSITYVTMFNGIPMIMSSNNVRPVTFQADYQDPITNIIIASNYTGTVTDLRPCWPPADPVIHAANFFAVFTPLGDLTCKIEPTLDAPTNIVIGKDYKGTITWNDHYVPFRDCDSIYITTSNVESVNLPSEMYYSTGANEGKPFITIDGWTLDKNPTNLMISTDYSGTIQIGDRFFTVSQITNISLLNVPNVTASDTKSDGDGMPVPQECHTNDVAWHFTIETNWVTTSVELSTQAHWLPATDHQMGYVVSNVLMTVYWHGQPHDVVVEKDQIGDALYRTIEESNTILL